MNIKSIFARVFGYVRACMRARSRSAVLRKLHEGTLRANLAAPVQCEDVHAYRAVAITAQDDGALHFMTALRADEFRDITRAYNLLANEHIATARNLATLVPNATHVIIDMDQCDCYRVVPLYDASCKAN